MRPSIKIRGLGSFYLSLAVFLFLWGVGLDRTYASNANLGNQENRSDSRRRGIIDQHNHQQAIHPSDIFGPANIAQRKSASDGSIGHSLSQRSPPSTFLMPHFQPHASLAASIFSPSHPLESNEEVKRSRSRTQSRIPPRIAVRAQTQSNHVVGNATRGHNAPNSSKHTQKKSPSSENTGKHSSRPHHHHHVNLKNGKLRHQLKNSSSQPRSSVDNIEAAENIPKVDVKHNKNINQKRGPNQSKETDLNKWNWDSDPHLVLKANDEWTWNSEGSSRPKNSAGEASRNTKSPEWDWESSNSKKHVASPSLHNHASSKTAKNLFSSVSTAPRHAHSLNQKTKRARLRAELIARAKRERAIRARPPVDTASKTADVKEKILEDAGEAELEESKLLKTRPATKSDKEKKKVRLHAELIARAKRERAIRARPPVRQSASESDDDDDVPTGDDETLQSTGEDMFAPDQDSSDSLMEKSIDSEIEELVEELAPVSRREEPLRSMPSSKLESNSSPETSPLPMQRREPNKRPQPRKRTNLMPEPRSEDRPEPRSEPRSPPQPRTGPRSNPRADSKQQPRAESETKSWAEPRQQSSTEPRTEPWTDPRSESSQRRTWPDPRPQSKLEPKTEPWSDPKTDPRLQPSPRSDPMPVPRLQPRKEPWPESRSHPRAEPRSEPRLQPRTEPWPESRSQPRTDPRTDQRTDQRRTESWPQPRPQPRPDPRLQPRTEPWPQPRPQPRTDPWSQPRPQPRSDPRLQPRTEPWPQPRPQLTPRSRIPETPEAKETMVMSDKELIALLDKQRARKGHTHVRVIDDEKQGQLLALRDDGNPPKFIDNIVELKMNGEESIDLFESPPSRKTLPNNRPTDLPEGLKERPQKESGRNSNGRESNFEWFNPNHGTGETSISIDGSGQVHRW